MFDITEHQSHLSSSGFKSLFGDWGVGLGGGGGGSS